MKREIKKKIRKKNKLFTAQGLKLYIAKEKENKRKNSIHVSNIQTLLLPLSHYYFR